jgi:hypothetical protein
LEKSAGMPNPGNELYVGKYFQTKSDGMPDPDNNLETGIIWHIISK